MVPKIGESYSSGATNKEKEMKKIKDLLLIELVIIINLLIDAGFAYIGWNILSSFISVNCSIHYIGWVIIFLFMKLIISGSGNSKSYSADEMLGEEFISIQIGRIFNKVMTILLMWLIWLVL